MSERDRSFVRRPKAAMSTGWPPRPRSAGGRRVGAVVAVCAVLGSHPAVAAAAAESAAPDDARLDRARELYQDARTAYDRGQYEEAARKFLLAYDLAGDPNLLFNLALVYDRLGDLERALEYLERYRVLAPEEEHAALDSRIEGLEARLAAVATRPEQPPSEKEPDRRVPPTEPSPRPPTEQTYRVFNATAIGLSVGAAVLLAVGAGTGIGSLVRTRAAKDGCEDVGRDTFCQSSVERDVAVARGLGIASDVTFAVGGALGVAALVVIGVRAKKKRSMASAWRVEPRIDPTTATFTLTGRF